MEKMEVYRKIENKKGKKRDIRGNRRRKDR